MRDVFGVERLLVHVAVTREVMGVIGHGKMS